MAPGSAVFGRVPAGQHWAGSPAERVGSRAQVTTEERPPLHSRWLCAYGASSLVLALVPIVAFTTGAAVIAVAFEAR